MKSAEQLEAELDALVQTNYYSEDYELQWTVRGFYDRLAPEDQDTFKDVILRRLVLNPDILNITICTRLDFPEAAPLLASLLDREALHSNRSRAIMAALRDYTHDDAFRAVERFVDSEQEREALLRLAEMDFGRSRRYILQAMAKPAMQDLCLHLFHGYRKAKGIPALVATLRDWAARHPAVFKSHFEAVLASCQGPYNPFAPEELEQLRAAAQG